MSELTPEKLDELERLSGGLGCALTALEALPALIAAARERDQLTEALKVDAHIQADDDIEISRLRRRTEKAEEGWREAQSHEIEALKRAEAAEAKLQELAHGRPTRVIEAERRANAAERDAKVLRKLEAKVREMSASDLEHGIHAQFTPTTFLRWIAKAREETDAE